MTFEVELCVVYESENAKENLIAVLSKPFFINDQIVLRV